ncbi:DNA cytosine methyltransferase [Tenacibaculum sp. MAR_2009_124]|uniref:DNA cytosine methyltransferase n=1 Tax=Tenacibaculum sp. MAR_2009_124 TaxID=1250059 RepID=UPI000B88D62A|nr:DNA cytosine methyltransferase [Tenacibaculum sp. MAR_2009_124]
MDCTKKHRNEQRVLSFCYGYGGLERGVSRVIPIKPVAYVEIEAFQNFNLVAAMESGLVDKAPIWTNLKTFKGKPFHNKVHGIIGGYPCQGESLAGKRKLWNDERFLWPYIERAIHDVRPLWCFFENVAGHLTGSFPYILESLRNMGYSVETGIYSASEVGAPHKRERVFILALDYSYIHELQKKRKARLGMDGDLLQDSRRQENSIRFTEASTEVVDTNYKRRNGNRLSSRQEKELPRASMSSEFISNSTGKRNRKSSKEYKTGFIEQKSNQWPAGPGERQFEWEEYRTIEPGMGCTVNGYNFRTELLRQYGNGVVAQTAEKAFSMLLDKHIKNIK